MDLNPDPFATATSGVFVLALLSALVYKLIDFGKEVAGAARGEVSWNGALTQAIVWVAGVVVVVLAGTATLTSQVALPLGGGTEVVLGDVDIASRVLIGMSLASLASGWNGLLGALDSTRSTAKPHLLESGPVGATEEDFPTEEDF
jgi:hypothetical protein